MVCTEADSSLFFLHRTSLKLTPAYSPNADGQTERMSRLLQEIMRTSVQADQLNWLERLDDAVMAITVAVDSLKTNLKSKSCRMLLAGFVLSPRNPHSTSCFAKNIYRGAR